MRIPLFIVCTLSLALASAHTGSTTNKQNLDLVGSRFKPLTYDQMTPEQKTMIDHLLTGERQSLGGPFNVLLRSPEMGDLARQVGASMRFHAALQKRAWSTSSV
jgi:hypothetical protein